MGKDIDSGLVYEASELIFNLDYYTVIQGWVGRDKDGFITIYQNKPTRDECDCRGFWLDNDSGSHIDLPITLFPDLTWESDQIEVELIIKRKKK